MSLRTNFKTFEERTATKWHSGLNEVKTMLNDVYGGFFEFRAIDAEFNKGIQVDLDVMKKLVDMLPQATLDHAEAKTLAHKALDCMIEHKAKQGSEAPADTTVNTGEQAVPQTQETETTGSETTGSETTGSETTPVSEQAVPQTEPPVETPEAPAETPAPPPPAPPAPVSRRQAAKQKGTDQPIQP